MAPLLVTLAFAYLPPGDRPHQPPDARTAELVRLARDRNRAAIASIRTLSCRFSHEVVRESHLGAAASVRHMVSGQYWWDGATVRVRTTFPERPRISGQTTDELIRGDKHWVLTAHPGRQGPQASLSVHQFDSMTRHFLGDVEEYCLFVHWGPKLVSYLSFGQLLAMPHEISQAGWVTEDGRDLLHVELAHRNGRLGFWFDPESNYLLRKTAMIPAAATYIRHEHHVTDFAREADGTAVPVRIEHRLFERGQLKAAVCTVLSDVRINKPLAPDDLRLPNIAGMTCLDWGRVSEYPVDADGNPAGPETPGRMEGNVFISGLDRPRPAEPDPLPAEEGLPDLGLPPRGEEWPVGVALLGSFLVIVVAASYAGRRPRRTT
jgi:hypothetical protein